MIKASRRLFTRTKLGGFLSAIVLSLAIVLGAVLSQVGMPENFSVSSIRPTISALFQEPTPAPVPPTFAMGVGDLTDCDGATCKLAIKIANTGERRVSFNLSVAHPQFRWVDSVGNPIASTIEENRFSHDHVMTLDPITKGGGRTTYLWMKGQIKPGDVPGIKLPNFRAERTDGQTLPFEITDQKFWLSPDGSFEKVTLEDGQDWFAWLSMRLGTGIFERTEDQSDIRHVMIGRDESQIEKLLLGIESLPEGHVKSINIYADTGICAYLPAYFETDEAQSTQSHGYCKVNFNTGELSLHRTEKVYLEVLPCQEYVTEDNTNIEMTVTYSAENKPDFKKNVVIPIKTSMLEACNPLSDSTSTQ